MAALVLFMVFLSGFTGLIYQVTWQKYLSVYLGSHALSTSLTLACFFLFLSFGYQLIGRYGHKMGKNRILTYGYIEGAIGVYAIVSPAIFATLYEVWPSYASSSSLHFVMSFVFALLLMGFPTFLMGGTIPLLTQGMSKELSEGHKVHAWVYGINTFGAFIGALIAGFYLIESLGLAQSLNVTGIVNCLLCVGLIVYCKLSRRNFEGYIPPKKLSKNNIETKLLAVAFASGFLSFGLESMIIRMAGLSIGSSNYTYTIIVSSFIAAIALGSVLASKSNDKNGLRWLISTQFTLILATFALGATIPFWPNLFLRVRLMFASSQINFGPYWFTIFTAFFLLLLVPVTLLGMTLPLLFQQLKKKGTFLNQTAGKMYAYNSVGATFGACIIGYLAFLFFNAQQIYSFLILLAGLNCSLLAFVTLEKQKSWIKLIPTVIALLGLFILPQWEDHDFVPARFVAFQQPPKMKEKYESTLKTLIDPNRLKVLFSDFGPNTYTVVTEDKEGERAVWVNSKADASTRGDYFTRTLTALIPLSISEKNEDIFIIGLGTGMSTGIAASFPNTKKVRVTEIAGGVIKALPFFEKWNFDLKDHMDKVEIINDDAYKVLKNEETTYDLIFSEPSNTWVTGVEKIYTQEFLNQVSKKLRPHGLYAQWFPLFSMSEDSFLSIVHNFKGAFENVTLWSAGGGATIIVASHKPLSVDLKKMDEKSKKAEKIYTSIKRNNAREILFHQIWSDPAMTDLARASRISHSLYHPTLAYQSGRAFFANVHVGAEKLAKKFFVFSDEQKKENTSKAISKSITSSGDDRLVWQKISKELSSEFYLNGIKFLQTQLPFAAGKLSIHKEELYPNKKLAKLDSENDKKMTGYLRQYQYLLEDTPKIQPTQVDQKTPLANELFMRYISLLTMRERPRFKNFLSKVPETCTGDEKTGDPEKPGLSPKEKCLGTKIEVLRFLKPKYTKELDLLRLNIKNKVTPSGETIEKMFAESTKNYRNQ